MTASCKKPDLPHLHGVVLMQRERRDGGDFLPLPIADTYPALTVGEGEEEEAYYADN